MKIKHYVVLCQYAVAVNAPDSETAECLARASFPSDFVEQLQDSQGVCVHGSEQVRAIEVTGAPKEKA